MFLESIIEFATTTFEITEPVTDDEPAVVRIPVIRRGDLSEPSAVRVYTKDGNAESGKDYNPVSKGNKKIKNLKKIGLTDRENLNERKFTP